MIKQKKLKKNKKLNHFNTIFLWELNISDYPIALSLRKSFLLLALY